MADSSPIPELRLLVVDDEAQILELLELTLSLQGFRVMTAESGPEALELAQAQQVDVVVMDVLMSPWDGFETVRQLEVALGEKLPPVVYLSGLNRAEDAPQYPGHQSIYLVKPFRPAQLVEAIVRVHGHATKPTTAQNGD